MTSYLDHHFNPRAKPDNVTSQDISHSWREHTFIALAWHYGPARAYQIHQGNDPATLADVASWQALGRRDAA